MNELDKIYCIWMIGISGSGKSTVAEEYAQTYNAQIMSSDKIREELYGDENIQGDPNKVFNILHTRSCELLKRGISIIYDCTNIKRKNRKKFFDYCKQQNINVIHHAVVMCTPYEICLRMNNKRDRKVPEEIIYKQMCNFNIPFFEEGFNYITLLGWGNHFININPNSPPQYLNWNFDSFLYLLDKMGKFDQKNHHHKFNLYEHSLKLSNILENKTEDNVLLTVAMVHDIGKLYTQTFDENGEAHYYNHAEVGTYKLLSNLDILKLNELEIIKCLFYVNYHMLPFNWVTDKTKEKYKKIFGEENYKNLCLLNDADKQACE